MRTAALLLPLFLAAPLHADEAVVAPRPPTCERERDPGLFEGPVVLGLLAGDLGAGRRACPRSELALGARALAIIDVPNFYGNVGLDARLEGSWAFARGRLRGEAFASVPFVSWQFAQNATLKGTTLGFGPLSVGVSFLAFNRDGAALTPYARLLLPTDALTLGGELGLAAGGPFGRLFGYHAVFAADLAGTVGGGPANLRAGGLILLGGEVHKKWFAFVLDLQIHMGWRAALDWFAPAAALRFRLYRGLGLELSTVLPVLGADRHDFTALLRLAWRFDGQKPRITASQAPSTR
jgi:hypothetical protein